MPVASSILGLTCDPAIEQLEIPTFFADFNKNHYLGAVLMKFFPSLASALLPTSIFF